MSTSVEASVNESDEMKPCEDLSNVQLVQVDDHTIAELLPPLVDGEMRMFTYTRAKDILDKWTVYVPKEISKRPYVGMMYCVDVNRKSNWDKDGIAWKAPKISCEGENPKIIKEVYEPKDLKKEIKKAIYYREDKKQIRCIQYFGKNATVFESEQKDRKFRKGLGIEEVLSILNDCDGSVSGARAIKPKGGEIYIFNTDEIGEDWKCDDYVWRNCGTAYIPSRNPVMKKTFFSIRTPKSGDKGCADFQKVAYRAIDKQNLILVQYLGDETVYTPMRHGNRKKGNIEHRRTCPSVISALKKKMSSSSITVQLSELPRNAQQVANIRHRVKKQKQDDEKATLYDTWQTEVVSIEEENNSADKDEVSNIQIESVQEDESTTLNETSGGHQLDKKPVLIQPLDPRPDVCKLQVEVLEQQKTNLKLQELKLRLEIEQLQEQKNQKIEDVNIGSAASDKVVNEQSVQNQQQLQHPQPIEEHESMVYATISESELDQQLSNATTHQNVVYVQDTNGVEQMVYIEGLNP